MGVSRNSFLFFDRKKTEINNERAAPQPAFFNLQITVKYQFLDTPLQYKVLVMAKILKIDNDIVYVGNDDGSLTEVRMSDCNFNPNVGDIVDLFTSENKTVCIKSTKSDLEKAVQSSGGININLNQNQNSNTGTTVDAYTGPHLYAVDKVTYIILALFLGGIGIHKFYANRTAAGIIYLLFCWTFIPALIAFIEAIIACFKTADNRGRILV